MRAVASCQATVLSLRSLRALMIETPYNAAQATAAIKNPDFGCRQKTGIGSKFASHGLLAICLTWLQAGRPNHHVAGINVLAGPRRQARPVKPRRGQRERKPPRARRARS